MKSQKSKNMNGKDIEGRRKRASLSGPGVSGQHGNHAKYAPGTGGFSLQVRGGFPLLALVAT